MQVSSTLRYAKISAFKVREVTRAIQGLPVSAALDLVAFSPKKAAGLIAKTLKSAVANAENNANLRVEGLVVKEATVGEGPTQKRMMPRARGSGSRILKRSSHIRIILTDEIEIKTREKKKQQKKKPKKAIAKKKEEPIVEEKPEIKSEAAPEKVEAPIEEAPIEEAPLEEVKE
jgi:large subunit ribosomal protein L22